jgi:hypothetical protein
MSHIMHKPVCAPTWLLQAQLAPCELVSLLQRPLGWRSKRHPRRCGLSTVQQPASLQCGSTASVYWSTDRRAAPDRTTIDQAITACVDGIKPLLPVLKLLLRTQQQ